MRRRLDRNDDGQQRSSRRHHVPLSARRGFANGAFEPVEHSYHAISVVGRLQPSQKSAELPPGGTQRSIKLCNVHHRMAAAKGLSLVSDIVQRCANHSRAGRGYPPDNRIEIKAYFFTFAGKRSAPATALHHARASGTKSGATRRA